MKMAIDLTPFALSLSKGASRPALCFDKLSTNGEFDPSTGALS